MRAITLLLIGAQALGFAQPAVCMAGVQEPPACEHAVPLRDAATFDGGSPCDACGMSDCHDMATCVATASVVTAVISVAWLSATLLPSDGTSIQTLHSYSRAPIRPPPRA